MTNDIQNPDQEPGADTRIPVDMGCLIDTLVAYVPGLLKDLTPLLRPSLCSLPGYELAALRVVHHIFTNKCEHFESRWDWRGVFPMFDPAMKRPAEKVLELYERVFKGDLPSLGEWKAAHHMAEQIAEDYRIPSSPILLLQERLFHLHHTDVAIGTDPYRRWWRELYRSPLVARFWRALFVGLIASAIALALYRHWFIAVAFLFGSYVPRLKRRIVLHTREVISARVQVESRLIVSAALAGLRWAERQDLSVQEQNVQILGGCECANTVELAIELSIAQQIESQEEIERNVRHWFEESRPVVNERLEETRRGCCLHYAIDLTRCVALALEDRSTTCSKPA